MKLPAEGHPDERAANQWSVDEQFQWSETHSMFSANDLPGTSYEGYFERFRLRLGLGNEVREGCFGHDCATRYAFFPPDFAFLPGSK